MGATFLEASEFERQTLCLHDRTRRPGCYHFVQTRETGQLAARKKCLRRVIPSLHFESKIVATSLSGGDPQHAAAFKGSTPPVVPFKVFPVIGP
jgi:hypothetical protein